MLTPTARAALCACASLPFGVPAQAALALATGQPTAGASSSSPQDSVSEPRDASGRPAVTQDLASQASTRPDGAQYTSQNSTQDRGTHNRDVEHAKPPGVESARPSVATLAPLVVTAQRDAQALADALPQTVRFDAQDIADTAARDLPGLLALAPGAQIVRNGGPGSTASLFLRGASPAQSLVLIDGVRIDSVSEGSAQLEQIPLDQIDHVEVVNGNVSALYGSGAIGGVVQVFTRDGGNHPPRFHFEAELGSYRTQRQAAGVDGALDRDGRTTFSIELARAKDDGFSSINPALAPVNPNANGDLNQSVSASLRHKFSERWDAGVRFFQSNGNDSFDDPFGLPGDLNNLHSRVQAVSAFANGKLTDWWESRLVAARGSERNDTALNGAYQYRYDTDNRQYTWQNDFAFAPEQKLQLGYEHLDQSLDSNQYTAPERHVNSVFAGYRGRLGASQWQANLRRDQYSGFGGANSYYLGYGYHFSEHWKATASWSDAFRAPSFNDLFFPFSGNPAIHPERSHSLEAALQYASDALGVLRLTAFDTRYSNLIDYVQTVPGVFVAQNVGRAKVQGVEGSWAGRVGRTEVRAALTLQNPVDEDTQSDLNRRARHFASFSANRPVGSWRVGGEWLVSGARHDSGTELAGYGVVNLSARYQITRAWHVAAQIQNLFDKDYELAYTYNTPRRGAYLTLGWQQQ